MRRTDLLPRGLPADIREKAIAIMDALAAGVHWRAIRGAKRIRAHKRVVSIPLGRDWRMLVDAETNRPLRVLSHQKYNKLVSKGYRLQQILP